MKTTNNTVLITGGSAGIGLAIARTLTAAGNHVIITGRNEERLQQAAAQLDHVTAITCDVTEEKDVQALVQRLEKDFPNLNVLINNAGQAYAYQLGAAAGAAEKAADEMRTNYYAVVNLTEQLLPLLVQQEEAAVVQVSSIVAFVPSSGIPTYSASKAALHSYTQSLRHELAKDTRVKVFELMPPLVNTAFSKDIGGEKGIAPEVVATDLAEALATDRYEIHVGDTAQIYHLSHTAPEEAFAIMNQLRLPA